MNRRRLMTSLAGLAGISAFQVPSLAAREDENRRPALAVFNPRQYGAVGDGKIIDSPAINAAIDACNQAGGGVVYLSPGTYLSGTVTLKSNVTLYLEAGAILLGSTNIADYKPKHLIYARDAKNLGIAGPGKIDGQGHAFWIPRVRKPVAEDRKWSDAVHNDWDSTDRPSPMLELINCTNLRIEDVFISGAAGWTLRPFNCMRAVIHGVTIKNPVFGPNTDGIDVTGCQDVLISDCIIDSGDDAICLKSEDVDDIECRTTKNIVVTNCIITGCCNGFKIGTKTMRGFENITFSNSVIYNDDVELGARIIAGISLEMVDGGWVDGVVISGIQMRRVRSPINIRRGNREKKQDYPQASLRGVLIEGIHATDAILTSSITGIPSMQLEDISLSDIRVDTVMPGRPEWVPSPVPEVEDAYPQARMFGWLPSSGLYCRHVRGLYLKDIHFSAPANEWRPAVICDDVVQLKVDGFSSSPVTNGIPPIQLVDVNQAWISGASAPVGSKAFLSIQGMRSSDILVSGCDVRKAAKLADVQNDLGKDVLSAQLNIGAIS